MKVIIPVAGEGKRLRPFTFTKPKPLLPVAGKPMINHIMDAILPLKPKEFVFIVGHLGHMMQSHIEKTYGGVAKLSFVEQKEINGPGGAVWLAHESLDEDVLIDYGDTLFEADLSIINDCKDDGIIWSLHVEDPRRFGVIVTDQDGYMTKMVEKPQTFVSNLVNIGLYYIKDVALFKEGLQYAMDNKQPDREVYLTEVFSYMIDRGARFKVVPCPGWFDCGTPEALLDANRILLPKHHYHSHENGNTIIPPVNIHPTAKLENCIIGPHVTIMANVHAKQAIMSDCILDSQSVVEDIMLKEMIVGESMTLKGVNPLQRNS
jgi:glucose-1-phosphate thymidylyltransferase